MHPSDIKHPLRLSALLSLFFASLSSFTAKAQQVETGCFGNGITIGSALGCSSQSVSTFCSTLRDFHLIHLTQGCVVSTISLLLHVFSQNIVTVAASPGNKACEDTLNQILSECAFGGLGAVTGGSFTFAVIANEGTCPAVVGETTAND